MTPDEQRVLDLIDADEIGELAAALVRASGANPPGDEGPAADVLAEACRSRGLSVTCTEVEPGRPNVSATVSGGKGPGLLLLGHTDVVPVGDGWSMSPFSGEIRDGRLFGRGSADMKGGLAACAVAMAALHASGIALPGPVELAAVVDEEETGKGIRHYLTTVSAGALDRFAGCVVAEPTELATVVAARGDSYLEVGVTGKAAHSGSPDQGANAIAGATLVVAELERMNATLAADAHPLVGAATWSVGTIRGGTGTSTVPAECVLTADRRLLPRESGDAVLAETVARIDALDLPQRGLGVDVRMTMEMPGFETPAGHPLVSTAREAVAAAGGPDLPVAGWTAACDGGYVARDAGLPVVVLGPGSVATAAHQADESVAVHELWLAARAYALCAMRMRG